MLVITIALCTALVAFVAWAVWKMRYGGRPTDARERCRRDIATLRRTTGDRSARDDVWSAGSDLASRKSRAKTTVAWVGIGTVDGGCGAGCGGCGGCGG